MKTKKRSLVKCKRGSVFAWVTITVAVFIVGILYMILTQPVIEIQKATNSTLNDADYASTYNSVIMVWKYWPLIMLLGLIIVGIIISIRKEPYTNFQ